MFFVSNGPTKKKDGGLEFRPLYFHLFEKDET